MQLTTWIGKHRQAIELGLVTVLSDFKAAVVGPVLLNLSFNLGMAVFMIAHAYGYIRSCLWLYSLMLAVMFARVKKPAILHDAISRAYH